MISYKRFVIILLCVLSFQSIIAQNFKFGKVSKAELEEKVHPLDSTANASIIYREEYVTVSFGIEGKGLKQTRVVKERLKIYNKEGFDWATKKIFLYRGDNSNKEVLSEIKGYTFNIENGKITKEKLKKSGVFKESLNEYYNKESFTMPNLKDGCVIEYQYIITSSSLIVDDINLQFSIPVNSLKVRFNYQDIATYNVLLNPLSSYLPKVKFETNQGSIRSMSSFSSVSATEQLMQNQTTFNVIQIQLDEKNIPALIQEPFSDPVNNYRQRLSLELTKINNQHGVAAKSFATNWENVSKTIYESSDFGNQLNRSGFFKDDVAAVASGVNDPFEKALAIQNYVKSKVKWNGIYGYSVQRGTRKAYMEGEGNVADINLLLIAMLRSQGVNANPVLVSTRNNGIPLYPTRKGFNYVICIVENGGDNVLIDASEPYSMINVLPNRVLNWQGRVIKDDGTSYWISLRSNKKATETTSLNVKLNSDLSASGKVRQNITSYRALTYRNRFSKLVDSDHIKSLEKNKGDIVISNLIFDNSTDYTKPVKITYDYELTDALEEIGDKLYFSPLLFFTTEESPFKLDERKYPIDFVVPFEDKYLVNIMLPEGYAVESMPESIAYEFGDNGAKFSYVAKQNGQYLQLSVSLDLKTSLILPKDYAVFKDFFENIVEKQTEQIVLTKS